MIRLVALAVLVGLAWTAFALMAMTLVRVL